MALKDITTQNPEPAPKKILDLWRKGLFKVDNSLNQFQSNI